MDEAKVVLPMMKKKKKRVIIVFVSALVVCGVKTCIRRS